MRLTLLSGSDFSSNIHILRDSVTDIPFSETLTFIPFSDWDSDEDFNDFKKSFKKLGFTKFIKFPLDIHYSSILESIVFDTPFIFLGGGNTYYFLKYILEKKLINKFNKYVISGGHIGGMSAGSILLTPNIDTAGYPKFDKDEHIENMNFRKSISLVDYEIFPHFKYSKRYIDVLLNKSKQTGNRIFCLRDQSGIIETNLETHFYGDIWEVYRGKISKITR